MLYVCVCISCLQSEVQEERVIGQAGAHAHSACIRSETNRAQLQSKVS